MARDKARKGRDRRGKVRAAVTLGTTVLSAVAVGRELRRPKKERTWQGNIGVVPYDFRAPTPKRIKRSLWAPDDPRVFVPRAFGIGWSVNFAAVKNAVKAMRSRCASRG
jgi:hypothetical protein